MTSFDWKKSLSSRRLRPSKPRITPSPSITVDQRNPFESDYGRIIFSPALRRMHDKTQVIPLTTDDNIHTRLTHSLEAASVAQSMGINICLNKEFKARVGMSVEEMLRTIPVILSCISLCHDIGNPPFGHFGEKVISSFFRDYFQDEKVSMNDSEKDDFTKFDGNAQGFRVLTRLQVMQDQYGLNLTESVLSAYLKYPVSSDELDKETFYKKKVGVFQSERELLMRLRQSTGLSAIRHPLAYLMEAADTICYRIMDIEDGFNRQYYSFEFLDSYLRESKDSETKAFITSMDQEFREIDDIGINSYRSKMVTLRVRAFQFLVSKACQEFLDHIGEIEDGSYNEELINKEDRGLIKALTDFCNQNIFGQREVCSLELTGESVLNGLLSYFVDDFLEYSGGDSKNAKKAEKLYRMISNSIACAVQIETDNRTFDEQNDYFKLRMIVDFISGMTDNYAVDIYQRLSGIKIA